MLIVAHHRTTHHNCRHRTRQTHYRHVLAASVLPSLMHFEPSCSTVDSSRRVVRGEPNLQRFASCNKSYRGRCSIFYISHGSMPQQYVHVSYPQFLQSARSHTTIYDLSKMSSRFLDINLLDNHSRRRVTTMKLAVASKSAWAV